MKTNRILSALSVIIIILGFTRCNVGDQEIKKLNRKDGTWTIESIHYEYYDSVGVNVISDSTQSSIGELIFFKTKTMDALWNSYLVVADMNQPNGTIAGYTGYIYIDGKRVYMQDDNGGGPLPSQFLGVWSVNKDTNKEQEWVQYVMSANNYLHQKTTIKLKKK